MTLIKRKCAERNRIYKKKMTNKQRNKKKKTHQGTKRGAGRMFRKIETQRGEKRLRLSVSTRRRRKKERNRDGEKKRDFLFPTHIFPLFPGVAARFRFCVVLVVVVVVTLSFFLLLSSVLCSNGLFRVRSPILIFL